MLWRKVNYEWLSLDAYQSYGSFKKWALEALANVGEKFQTTFALLFIRVTGKEQH